MENMVYANQLQYYDAITANSNAADSGPFIDFMLGKIQKALEAHKREPIKKVPDKIPDKLLQAFPEMQSMAWSGYMAQPTNPVECVQSLTQKHVAKRYMIGEKFLPLRHES